MRGENALVVVDADAVSDCDCAAFVAPGNSNISNI